jgi:hypothetical protein
MEVPRDVRRFFDFFVAAGPAGSNGFCGASPNPGLFGIG